MSHKKPLCIAPWSALSIKPNGDVGPDVQFSTTYGNIEKQTLNEIWNSAHAREVRASLKAGQFHASCSNCKKKEDTVGHSRRIFFDHTFPQTPWLNTDDDAPPDIRYLDLNLSNRCNLKCRMCNGISSSAWLSEERILAEQKPIYDRPPVLSLNEMQVTRLTNLLDNFEYFKNLQYVALRGGEPLMEKQNIIFLEKLVEWGLAPGIVVDISTNGSVINPQLVKTLSHFKHTELYISIEGVDDLYQYVRGGQRFSITELEKNLEFFRKIERCIVIFAVTVSIYNILRLEELWQWFAGIRRPGEEMVMTNVVVRPSYLNYQILPVELKQLALQKLRQSSIPVGDYHTGLRYMGDIGRRLIEPSLEREVFTPLAAADLLRKFVAFNRDVDRVRGTNILDVIPEYAPLFKDQQDMAFEQVSHA